MAWTTNILRLHTSPCLSLSFLYAPSTPRVLYGANVFKITLFPLGGFLLVAKDFEGPDVPSEVLREQMYLRRRRMVRSAAILLKRLVRLSQHPNAREISEVEKGGEVEKKNTTFSIGSVGKVGDLDQNTITGTTITPTLTIGFNDNGSEYSSSATLLTTDRHDLISRLRHFLRQLLKPCTIVIILSFVVSLVDPLKALFIPPSSTFQPHFRPVGPDGQPPLAFIFDTATFIGEACVPLGLICLGSALTSLNLRSGEPFPKCAIASLALGKMVVIPIIGVAITRGFVHVGFMNRDDKVLQFVCMCVVSSLTCQLHSIYSLTHPLAYYLVFLLPRLR